MASASLQTSVTKVSPQQVLEVTWGFAATHVIATAIELDLFTCIDRGHTTVEDLAGETGSSHRGLRILLDALVGMKYLEKADGRYQLAPVAREGASHRYEYLTGNFRRADFGEARFDVAILGHICHSEGPVHTQELFARVHRALKPGGHILIADLIADDERQEAGYPLLFAVNMLVNTEEGDTFTLAEYRQWLLAAGFDRVRTLQAPSSSPLILASR